MKWIILIIQTILFVISIVALILGNRNDDALMMARGTFIFSFFLFIELFLIKLKENKNEI